jgi:hypothetical protein
VIEQLHGKPTSSFTVDEVKLVLTHLGVKHDPAVIDKYNVDGNALLRLTTSMHVRARLGVKFYGTACFVQHALQYSQANQLPLVAVLPLNALPYTADNVMSWRVDDVCVWLGQHNLGALEPAFRKHEINGAALVLMDEFEFSNYEDTVLEHEHELQQARAVLLAQRKCLMV